MYKRKSSQKMILSGVNRSVLLNHSIKGKFLFMTSEITTDVASTQASTKDFWLKTSDAIGRHLHTLKALSRLLTPSRSKCPEMIKSPCHLRDGKLWPIRQSC